MGLTTDDVGHFSTLNVSPCETYMFHTVKHSCNNLFKFVFSVSKSVDFYPKINYYDFR